MTHRSIETASIQIGVELLKEALLSELRKPVPEDRRGNYASVVTERLGFMNPKDAHGDRDQQLLTAVFNLLRQEGKARLVGHEWRSVD